MSTPHHARVVLVVSFKSYLIRREVTRCAVEDPRRIPLFFPELGLHPEHHAKEVRELVLGKDRSVIGTHSEAILSAVGEAIEAKRLAAEDVVIVMVDEDVAQRIFAFNADGHITGEPRWPIGFFAPSRGFL